MKTFLIIIGIVAITTILGKPNNNKVIQKEINTKQNQELYIEIYANKILYEYCLQNYIRGYHTIKDMQDYCDKEYGL